MPPLYLLRALPPGGAVGGRRETRVERGAQGQQLRERPPSSVWPHQEQSLQAAPNLGEGELRRTRQCPGAVQPADGGVNFGVQAILDKTVHPVRPQAGGGKWEVSGGGRTPSSGFPDALKFRGSLRPAPGPWQVTKVSPSPPSGLRLPDRFPGVL